MADERPPAGAWRGQLLGAAFELLYHNRALYWLASTIPFAGQWRTWQRRVIPRLTGHDVLEVGCGLGTLLADMIAAGYRCHAVDASPHMVAATRGRLRRNGVSHPEDLVRLARVQHLPFDDASFDTVVSTFPTPYIYETSALVEIARVLRPGGRLVVVEGASLLPANAFLRPLVLFQSAVYGGPSPRRPAAGGATVPSQKGAVRTIPVPSPRSGIPLEQGGLMRREEVDASRWWLVFIVVGEKPAQPG